MKSIIILLSLYLGLSANALSVMSYNVLNLFDAKHDIGKNDFEFLPDDESICNDLIGVEPPKMIDLCRQKIGKYNWTEESVGLKIGQIKKAVLSHNGKLPDILTLSEIENSDVVELIQIFLGYDGYFATTSPDKRGIDVALLYKNKSDLALIGLNELKLKMKGQLTRPTRNVLDAEFLYKGESLHILVNHWPSQFAKTPVRLEVSKQVGKYVDRLLAVDPLTNIVVTGDFNTIPSEFPHPIREFQKRKGTKFRNLHFENEFQFILDDVSDFFKPSSPMGSYYYYRGDVWNMLDLFLVSDSLFDGFGLEVDVYSYSIVHEKLSRVVDNKHGIPVRIPWRYNHRATSAQDAGFSDHYPIYMEIK